MDNDSNQLTTLAEPGQLNLGLVYQTATEDMRIGNSPLIEVMLSFEQGKFPGAFNVFLTDDETRALGELLRNKQSGRVGSLEIKPIATAPVVPADQLAIYFDTGFHGMLFINLSDAVITQLAAQCDIILNEAQQRRAQASRTQP